MRYLWAGAFTLIFFISNAQTKCGQHILEKEQCINDSALEQDYQQYDHWISEAQFQSSQRGDKFIIPVVFHIIHQNGAENIADEQVYDAMRIINESYRAENEELSGIASQFVPLIGNADIEFRLAKLDPNGQPTTGIDRIQSAETNVGDDGSKLNPWPRSKYLNIWVTNVISVSGAAAYAYRPPSVASSNAANVDGIISNHRYVGSIGTASESGKFTLTHEIGHYLGLPHTWGPTNEPGLSTNCQVDDNINDTPNTIGVGNSTCNLTQTSCGTLDNVQNFMDYASCESMFTTGQINVMRATLASSVAQRNQLVTANNLASTGVSTLTTAHYYLPRQTLCRGELLELKDESTYDAETWSWTLSNDYKSYTSSDKNPQIVMDYPGIYDLELTVTKGNTSKTLSQASAISVLEYVGFPVPYVEDFQEVDPIWLTDEHEVLASNNHWQHATNAGNGDNFSYKMYNIGATTQSIHDLILTGVDMRPLSAFEVSFDVAYRQISASNNDKLQVLMSNDCGEVWRTVFTRSGATLSNNAALSTSVFNASAGDFHTFSINNVPIVWTGENTSFMFRFTSEGGNNIFLDNVNITGTYKNEAFLVYPGNGAEGVGTQTKLDWLHVNNASSYALEIDTDQNFNTTAKQTFNSSALGNYSLNQDTEHLMQGLAANTTYYWRVKANTTNWSETWAFKTTDNTVGVDLNRIANIHVFPNPATNRLHIAGELGPNVQVVISSLAGQVICNALLNTEQGNAFIDISSLRKGIYFISITGERVAATKQFVKAE